MPSEEETIATLKAKKAGKGKSPILKVHTPYGVASKVLTKNEIVGLIRALAPYLEVRRRA